MLDIEKPKNGMSPFRTPVVVAVISFNLTGQEFIC